MLDTDKPKIALPLLEFFTLFVRTHQKAVEVDASSTLFQQMGYLTQVLMKRFAYPAWFMEMGGHTADPDDYSEGRLDEHKTMREYQIALFSRICVFKPIAPSLIQMLQT